MTILTYLSAFRDKFQHQYLREKSLQDFFDGHFLVFWLPFIVATAMGLMTGLLVSRGDWQIALVLILIAPVCLIFIKYPFLAILIWIIVFPYFLRTATVNDRYIYWLLHRAMIPATLLGTIFFNWRRILTEDLKRLRVIDLILVVFAIYAYANIVYLSKDVNPTVIKFFDLVIIPFCLYWLIRLINPSEKDLKLLVWFGVISVVIQFGISLLSWYMPGLLPGQWRSLVGARTVGTFGNPAVYTSYVMLLSILGFSFAMHLKPGLKRLWFIAIFGLAIIAILFSFSRDSWLALSLVLIGLTFMYRKVMFSLLTLMVVLAIILGATLLSSEIEFAIQRINSIQTAEDRVIQVVAALRMINEKPVFGWGFLNYDLYKEGFKTNVGTIENQSTSTSHNTFLSILAELGIVGFSLYMLPFIWWLIVSFKMWKKLPDDGWMGKSWLMVFWLFLLFLFTVNNFLDMIRFHLIGNALWWIGLAFVGNILTQPKINRQFPDS